MHISKSKSCYSAHGKSKHFSTCQFMSVAYTLKHSKWMIQIIKAKEKKEKAKQRRENTMTI